MNKHINLKEIVRVKGLLPTNKTLKEIIKTITTELNKLRKLKYDRI